MDKNVIKEHPTWAIIDSSKLQEYQACPRKFFFRYILGWDLEITSHHLVFGESWHQAMEHILIHGYVPEVLVQAANIAEVYYRQHFSASSDGERGAKVPGNIPISLAYYAQNYAFDKFEVLYTEIRGVVPVSEDRVLYFRMDSIMRDPMHQNLIISLEHKTAGRKDAFSKYTTNIQSGTYNHVLYSSFEKGEVYGVIINGVVFYIKNDPLMMRLPARRNEDSMAEWLWSVNQLMDRLDWDMEELNESSEDEQVMCAFAKNTEFCHQYGECKYYDFCHVWSNPIQYIGQPPFGFKEVWWDPSERESKAIFDGGTITPIDKFLEGEINVPITE